MEVGHRDYFASPEKKRAECSIEEEESNLEEEKQSSGAGEVVQTGSGVSYFESQADPERNISVSKGNYPSHLKGSKKRVSHNLVENERINNYNSFLLVPPRENDCSRTRIDSHYNSKNMRGNSETILNENFLQATASQNPFLRTADDQSSSEGSPVT
jgi:hypothetical protein